MPELCIIVPCYNEAQRLRGEAFTDWVEAAGGRHLLFVNDGSSDSTSALLHRLAAERPRIQVLDLARNVGKAEAVRQGVLAAVKTELYELVGYWDADLSTPLNEADRFCEILVERPHITALLGCRLKRMGAKVHRSALRHYGGRVVAAMISIVLRLPTYDTQCGAKIFRVKQCPQLFNDPFLSRWLFDVEILARMRNELGRDGILERVVEVPLNQWLDYGGSKLTISDSLRVFPELWAIRKHYS